MKKRAFSLFLSLMVVVSLMSPTSATGVSETTVPVTLTVINTIQKVSVTVPASLPISVVDDQIVVADNAAICNNASEGAVMVTAVTVKNGSYTISNFDNFPGETGTIALSLNGCGTLSEGALAITTQAFPVIEVGSSLPIQYNAKVAVAESVSNATAAFVIFTISTAPTTN